MLQLRIGFFLANMLAIIAYEVDGRIGKLPINKKNGLPFNGMVVWTWAHAMVIHFHWERKRQ